MAGVGGPLIIRNRTGETILYQDNNYGYSSSSILGEELNGLNIGVTNVAYTIGGEAIDNNTDMLTVYNGLNDGLNPLYDVTPSITAETITGFYLDGTKYEFGGGGTAEGISTDQPSNPVAGSTYYDTTNNVIKVYNGTSWEEVGGGNVIAMTQATYDALPAATKNDGKLRIITDATGIEMADKAYVDGLVGDIESLLAAI